MSVPLLTSVLAGCAGPLPVPMAEASRSYVVLLSEDDGSTGKLIFRGSMGHVELEHANQAASLSGRTETYEMDPAQLRRDAAPAVGAQPLMPKTFVLHYEVGEARVNKGSEAVLRMVLEDVRSRAVPDLSVTGHTDTVGNPGLNESLSLRRAEQVAKLLRAAAPGALQLEITSHGERNLLIPTPDNTSEPRNRRVEITVR